MYSGHHNLLGSALILFSCVSVVFRVIKKNKVPLKAVFFLLVCMKHVYRIYLSILFILQLNSACMYTVYTVHTVMFMVENTVILQKRLKNIV